MTGYRGRGRGGRGQGGSSRPQGGSSRSAGAFVDGVWHCDCSPALPAVHFQVKKEGPNKGLWFRSCQKRSNDGSRCKFFLWDSDAAPREVAALANNSRTEPGRSNTTPSRPRTQKTSPPPPYTSEAGPSNASNKRNRANAHDNDDEFGFRGNTAFEEELDQVMTAIETPSKRPRTEAFATPARRKLPWQKDELSNANGLQTPQTEQRTASGFLTTPIPMPRSPVLAPSTHTERADTASQFVTPASSPFSTPTPNRFKDAVAMSADSDLARGVFSILQDANVELPEQTRMTLTAALAKHATITEGVKKGRDVARASIKAKDAKVTELTYRVNTLEAELEAERAAVKHLQWKVESGHQSD